MNTAVKNFYSIVQYMVDCNLLYNYYKQNFIFLMPMSNRKQTLTIINKSEHLSYHNGSKFTASANKWQMKTTILHLHLPIGLQ